MARLAACLAVLFLLGYSDSWAQCAPGVPSAGNPACIPPDQPSSPYYQGGKTPAPPPPAVWSDRWGAVAVDESTGDAGTVENRENKTDAENQALSDCASTGAQNCKVILTYHNQCAAVAFSPAGSGVARAPTSTQAEQLAIKSCGNGSACQIVYSKCSLPVRIK
jgi:hypothetical protein